MTTSEAPAAASNYRGLLAIVILLGMAIMLVVGALIGAAFVGGTGARERTAGSGRTVPAAFLANLAAPGSRIESAELQGNRILVRLTGAGGDALVVLDAATGRIVGRVVLGAGP